MNQSDISIAVMAGGRSSRMGTDKSFALLLGKPLIEHVIDRIRKLSDELMIITNEPDEYAHLSIPLFGDIFPGLGPLSGIHAALSHSSRQYVLVVACDMPWLNQDLLLFMVSLRQSADVIVPRWQKFPEPMHAIYSKNCLTPIEDSLKASRLKSIAFYDKVKVRYLDREEIARFDRKGRSFANVNTPEDLANAGN